MQYSETINQYYQQILRLWKHIKTSADKLIKKFIHILQLLIFVSLLGRHYTNIKNLLNKARNIEDMKKNTVVNFSKQKRFTILKLNQRPKKLVKRSIKESARLIGSAAESTNTKKLCKS